MLLTLKVWRADIDGLKLSSLTLDIAPPHEKSSKMASVFERGENLLQNDITVLYFGLSIVRNQASKLKFRQTKNRLRPLRVICIFFVGFCFINSFS